MRELLWRLVATIATRPAVTAWLIERAQRTPYFHLTSPDGSPYMGRWWLFNPYPPKSDGEGRRWTWLPSVRIHHIMRADRERHLHDHPWNARTIVLRGWYEEERPSAATRIDELLDVLRFGYDVDAKQHRHDFHRARGYTGRLLFGQYHRISAVSEGGVWTMFWTWRKRGTWGFDVDGVKVPWREYLHEPPPGSSKEGGAA